MIQLAAGANYVAYRWDAPEMTLADALASIADYFTGAYRWNREAGNWSAGYATTVFHPGEHWAITVSQACTLENFRWWFIHISAVVVPVRAVAGASVPVEVKMDNCRPETIPFKCTGEADGVTVEFPDTIECPGGEVGSVSGYFTMPNNDVTLTITGWYWGKVDWVAGSIWVPDDWRQVVIASAAPPGILEQLIPMIMMVMMMKMMMPMMGGK